MSDPLKYPDTLVSDEQFAAIEDFADTLVERAKTTTIHDDVRAQYQKLHDWVDQNCDGRISSVAAFILALAMEDAMQTGAPDVIFPESVSHKFTRLEMQIKHNAGGR